MAYLTNKYLANIKKWNINLSKYKDGVYEGYLQAPNDIKEFRGFEELFGFEIKELKGSLSFWNCTSLTSVSNLPRKIDDWLSFYYCISLTSVSNLPDCVGYNLSFENCKSLKSLPNLPQKIEGCLDFESCTSLTSIGKMPSVVKDYIYTYVCPFFENLTEAQIRKKYGIRKE